MVASYPDRHRWHDHPLIDEMLDIRLRIQSPEDRHLLLGEKRQDRG
jgi:hypothetical protein